MEVEELVHSLISKASARTGPNPKTPMGSVVSEAIKRNSFLVKFTQRAWDRIFAPTQGTAANPVEISKENESALKKLLGWAQSATVILLTMKDEAALGADNPYTRLANMLFSRLGVNYQSFSISPDNVLPRDGHPSEAGYAQVRECLQRILRQSRASGSETSKN